MEHKEFLKRYIKPFYMDLMKMNFISKEEEYTKDMFKKLKSISKELTDQQLIEMLNDAWRHSKAGAWMIGLGDRNNLITNLEEYLKFTPSDHVEHVIVNLYILSRENAASTLLNFIKRQIEYFVSQTTYIEFEKMSIHWAIGMLRHIDEIYNHKNLENIYSSSWWQDFTIHLKERRDSDIIMKLIESNYYYETIKETIRRINN